MSHLPTGLDHLISEGYILTLTVDGCMSLSQTPPLAPGKGVQIFTDPTEIKRVFVDEMQKSQAIEHELEVLQDKFLSNTVEKQQLARKELSAFGITDETLNALGL